MSWGVKLEPAEIQRRDRVAFALEVEAKEFGGDDFEIHKTIRTNGTGSMGENAVIASLGNVSQALVVGLKVFDHARHPFILKEVKCLNNGL